MIAGSKHELYHYMYLLQCSACEVLVCLISTVRLYFSIHIGPMHDDLQVTQCTSGTRHTGVVHSLVNLLKNISNILVAVTKMLRYII